jgi:prolipoprotein diacylglyceryltransferase
VDFGDGVRRHPTQIYEILVALLIGAIILLRSQRPHARGALFRLFLLLYLVFRFAVDFIKPTNKPYLGTSAIQIASLLGAVTCAWQLHRRAGFSPHEKEVALGRT